MRYAFINADGIVVQVIMGELSEEHQAIFLNDYSALFGATQVVAVAGDTSVYINGEYRDGVFLAPAQAEAPELS